MKRRSPPLIRLLFAAGFLGSLLAAAPLRAAPADLPSTCYLFSYFLNNGEDGLHLAWSRDGYHWEAPNGGRSYLTPEVGESKLMRDPCLIQGPDGKFHLVWTTSWQGSTIGYASSADLIHWSKQQAIPVMAGEPGARNCWAPEIVWDTAQQRYLIFWATTLPGKFTETASTAENSYNHRIYATTTKDFQSFTPTRLFYEPGFNVIDATLLPASGKWHLIVKDETPTPPKKNLRIAVGDSPEGPFRDPSAPFTRDWVEGPTALKVGDEYLVYFDAYRDRRYEAMRSRDLKTWEDVTAQMTFPRGMKHGTALAVPAAVVKTLLDAGGSREARITVDTRAPGVGVSPTMFGVFFEDINYGADGGLYAELVQNRSFEHRDALHAWSKLGERASSLAIATEQPIHTNNPKFLRLNLPTGAALAGVVNAGWDGIAVSRGEEYHCTVWARAGAGFSGKLVARLLSPSGKTLAEADLGQPGAAWQKLQATLRAPEALTNATLGILTDGSGTLDLDVVSLFPANTWNHRPNGLRADLVQKLANLKPGFMRFPGGCIVEGRDLANAYRWKETVGDISERKQNWNRWQDAVDRKAPQYYQTYGLGFFEYFQLCEDIGAEPVPILNCGMSCQYQDKQFVPLEELQPWVQDALDLVEFANGAADTTWGALRARMGHPAPFQLKFLGVGNEQWDEQYFARYLPFHQALKAKYPNLTLITTAGPGVDDRWWNLAWAKFKAGTPADIVDEHYYRPPQWFLSQAGRYDRYDRNGPKVFAGEFAAHEPGRRSTLRAALYEAAFMTGLLRNADVVRMASYAPLFARAGHTQWEPDLIWFDATRSYGTPSYYAQQLFSRNRPDTVLPTRATQPGVVKGDYRGKVGVGTWRTQAEFKDLQVTRGGQTLYRSDFTPGLPGWNTLRGKWETVDGVLRQTSDEENVQAMVGDASWGDYTYTLKARKTGGAEGFLVIFQSPGDGTPVWWNLGGWNNSEHGLELPGAAENRVRGRIETGRWYDIRIECDGGEVKCYLDDKLVQQSSRAPSQVLYAIAGRDDATKELVLFAVNVAAGPVETTFELEGVSALAAEARATVLTSGDLLDVNSFTEPSKVSPRGETVRVSGPTFRHTLPANSLTVLRLRPQP